MVLDMGKIRDKSKTETLNLRVSPDTKTALRDVAARERRSMANMVEVLVLEYHQRTQTEEKFDNN
jgi:hypothetical protein